MHKPHLCPRKINVPAPMIMGLSAAQSFFLVSTIITGGILATRFKSVKDVLLGWAVLALLIGLEILIMKIINTQRRALIYHNFLWLKNSFRVNRFAGRGSSVAWNQKNIVGGERPY